MIFTGFDGGHEYSRLYQPEQHQQPDENQQLNEIFIEIPPPNIRLDLCPVCSRKFAPESLMKHVIICEKINTKKRKPFDSAEQRLKDTEFKSVVPQSPIAEKRLTPQRVSPPKTVSCPQTMTQRNSHWNNWEVFTAGMNHVQDKFKFPFNLIDAQFET